MKLPLTIEKNKIGKANKQDQTWLQKTYTRSRNRLFLCIEYIDMHVLMRRETRECVCVLYLEEKQGEKYDQVHRT